MKKKTSGNASGKTKAVSVRKTDVTRAIDELVALCAIPSPSGFTAEVTRHLSEVFQQLGYAPQRTRKGSVLVDLGGEGAPLALAAHVDTLGGMVRAVKSNGRLRMTRIGGFSENTLEGENCTIFTRDGRRYRGALQLNEPSAHVSADVRDAKRDDTTMEVVIDEKVATPEDVRKLGIRAGDFIAFDPRTEVTASGFIKSRHLDDKASAGILIALAAWLKEKKITPARRTWLLFTTYEEVGHGGASGLPEELTEMISVDMGAVGDDLLTDEHTVSICAKDSRGPYDYAVTTRLIQLAEKKKLSYAVDIYPSYGSDVEAALSAGYDITHGLIGPGVYASHGYERTHRDGVENTLKLLAAYIQLPPEIEPES
jgi:putative aminopeptidase FrvX